MPITYIVLSDLHLGKEDSLFTPAKKGDNRLLNTFADSLQSLVESNTSEDKPTLVLNGDILS